MFRIPQDRKSRIQLVLIGLFVGVFAYGVKAVADYLDWTAQSVDLRDAISRGDLEAVKQFEADGVDWRDLYNLPDHYGALHQAVGQNHLHLVRYFVEQGADVSAPMTDGTTPVAIAAMFGHGAVMKYLLMETPEGEAIARSESFIHPVGPYADLELVAWLSERVDLKDSISTGDAHRLLCEAVKVEDDHMVEYLIAIGAPGAMDHADWDEGFQRAPQSNGGDAVRWLALYDSPDHFLLLHEAARLGNEAIVKRLIDHGAKPETKDARGNTPIDYAREDGHDAVVVLLEAARDGG